MTITRRGLIGLAGMAIAAALTLSPAAAQEQDPLRIGLLLSLSGPAASFGIPERDMVQLLADKTNADGGVNGRKVELHIYDDSTNPTEAARGARQLILQDKVHAIIGSGTGSGTLAAGPIAAQGKVPMLAPNGTDAVTSKDNTFYDYIFRTLPSDRSMGAARLCCTNRIVTGLPLSPDRPILRAP